MKTNTLLSLLAAVSTAFSSVAVAASVKDYEVTGPVVEMTDTMIVLEKGKNKERHEIARDSNTKTSGEVKVGDKATVHFTMTATKIEAKGPAKAGKADAKSSASPSASPATN